MISRSLAPETVDPILSKEPDVTRGLRKIHLSGLRARERVSPTNPGEPPHEARGLEWLRPLALGTVSEESVLEGDGGWREG